jgi:uncharacterized protein (TIGR03066 family)
VTLTIAIGCELVVAGSRISSPFACAAIPRIRIECPLFKRPRLIACPVFPRSTEVPIEEHQMKRPVIALVGIIAIVAIGGCRGSSTTAQSADANADKLVGVWTVKKINDEDLPKDQTMTIEFTKDGKTKFNSGGRTEEGTYKVEGDKVTIIKANEEDNVVNIKSLTANALILADDVMSMELTR